MKAKYIPNVLSVLRILMSPAFAAVFIWWYPEYIWTACVIFALAGITDVADGILARRFGWITQSGKILDPIADKLMQCTALLCLSAREIIPYWILAIVLAKEIMMALGAIILFRKSHEIGVSKNYGKAYTVVFYFVVIMFLVFGDKAPILVYSLCTVIALLGATVVFLYYRSYLKNKMSRTKKGEELS